MRQVKLTACQYRNFVYPALTLSAAKRLDEWDTALRTVRKLKDQALTTELPLTDEQQKARDAGNAVYPERTLLEGDAVFALEEDEHALLRDRLTAYKTQIRLVAADDFDEVCEAVAAVPKDGAAAPE